MLLFFFFLRWKINCYGFFRLHWTRWKEKQKNFILKCQYLKHIRDDVLCNYIQQILDFRLEKHEGESSFTHMRMKLTLRTSGQRRRGAGVPNGHLLPWRKQTWAEQGRSGQAAQPEGGGPDKGALFATEVLTSDCPWGQRNTHVSPPKKYH